MKFLLDDERTMNRILPDNVRYAQMDTQGLRDGFLIESLFAPGTVSYVCVDIDRAIIGSAVPMGETLTLPTDATLLRAEFFLQRRELGILNVGAAGNVTVDGATFAMGYCDCLYVGRGARDVTFASDDATNPAKFYLLSYPAHAGYPTALARRDEAEATHLGSPATANERTIRKYIHPSGISSCQLVMGFTELATGSMWNTMPAHTHLRRSEVYLYFGLAPDARVFHLMGEPNETRHLVIANEQAVVSPSWSIHAGAGTGAYTFCWGMGGENQEFADMDAVPVESLR